MKKLLDFIRSRPTETWLGLWTAAVAVAAAAGVDLDAVVVTAVQAVIGALTTFVASRPTNTWGPQ